MFWKPDNIHSIFTHCHTLILKEKRKLCNWFIDNHAQNSRCLWLLYPLSVFLSVSVQGNPVKCQCRRPTGQFMLLSPLCPADMIIWLYLTWCFEVFSWDNPQSIWLQHQSLTFLFPLSDPEPQTLQRSDTTFVLTSALCLSYRREREPDVCSVSLSLAYLLCAVRLGKTKQ